MHVRTLWAIVAVVWLVLCAIYDASGTTAAFGVGWCVVGAWRGWLAGKHGVYR